MKTLNTILVLAALIFTSASCKKDKNDTTEPSGNGSGSSKFSAKSLPDGSQTFTGNLSDGKIMSELSWAWNSSMACFPEVVKERYQGTHKLYQIDLPSSSTMDIYLRPTNDDQQMSLYGYSIGAGKKDTPPEISSCVSCESSPSTNGLPSTGEQHIYLNAVTNPYSVIFGVAGGAAGEVEGAYEIEIVVES